MFLTLPTPVRGFTLTAASPLAEAFAVLDAMPVTKRQPDLFGYQPWNNSGFTDAEVFHMTGTLPPERIERLVDQSTSLGQLEGIDRQLAEAENQYPPEDFLHEVVTAIGEVVAMLGSRTPKAEARQTLINVQGMLSDMLQTQFYATEYGLSELKKVTKTLINTGLAVDHEAKKA